MIGALKRRASGLLIPEGADVALWRARWSVEKRWGDDPTTEPYEVLRREGNLLMYGGASCLWECLEGNGTATVDQDLTYFDNTNAAIGVGDSSTAAAATQNDMQAASNKLRKGMEATYPTHTDGETSGAEDVTYRSVFGTSEANWTWNEWGVFNADNAATGRMLNRKVENLGTKTSAASWTFTVTLSLA